MVILCLVFEEPPNSFFHSTFTILHSHQKCVRDPISAYPCWHLLFSIKKKKSYPIKCEVVRFIFLKEHSGNSMEDGLTEENPSGRENSRETVAGEWIFWALVQESSLGRKVLEREGHVMTHSEERISKIHSCSWGRVRIKEASKFSDLDLDGGWFFTHWYWGEDDEFSFGYKKNVTFMGLFK